MYILTFIKLGVKAEVVNITLWFLLNSSKKLELTMAYSSVAKLWFEWVTVTLIKDSVTQIILGRFNLGILIHRILQQEWSMQFGTKESI